MRGTKKWGSYFSLAPKRLLSATTESARGLLEPLRHDLLVLLLYVQRHSPKVLTKQRLPITAVRALNPRLAKKQDISGIRTHTEVPRLWFLRRPEPVEGCKLARQAHLIEAQIGACMWVKRPSVPTKASFMIAPPRRGCKPLLRAKPALSRSYQSRTLGH